MSRMSASERERTITEFAPVFPPPESAVSYGQLINGVRCKRFSLRHTLVSCASLTAPGSATASQRSVRVCVCVWGGLAGTRPTPPGITLDMSSEVCASHCLMEAVGQQARIRAKGE